MASSPKLIHLPYRKLSLEEDDDDVFRRSTSYSYRFKRVVSLRGGRRRGKRVGVKIRRLRGFVRKRANRVKTGILKLLKRLKESQSHFGDLFAGSIQPLKF